MVYKIPEETIEKLGERMKADVDAPEVAQEFGVSTTTVYMYTKDLPRKYTRVPPDEREEIHEKVRNGYSKREVAKMYHRSLRTIQVITKDIPGYFGYKYAIGSEELQLLRRLLSCGYLISNFYLYAARNLKLQLPFIRSIRIHGKIIFYLTGKEREALQAYIRNKNSRLIDYSYLNKTSKLMGIDLSAAEQEDFVHQSKIRNVIQLKIEDCGVEHIY